MEDKIACNFPWTEEKNNSLRDCVSADDLSNYATTLDSILFEGEPNYYNFTGARCLFPCTYYHYTVEEEGLLKITDLMCVSS